MFSVDRTPVNKLIHESVPGVHVLKNVVEWRDEERGVKRIVVTGLALVSLGIINLIDSVLSAVAAVFTSPLLLVGNSIPKSFANRAILVGLVGGLSLIFAQYLNVTKNNLGDGFKEIISSFL